MQKPSRLLLATLALLGTSAAFAQSSVTLYGRVNTSMERQKTGDVTSTVLQNNSSRFGFRGSEDLGGGLKAGFVLESGFNSDDGGNTQPSFFKRQSEVNLSGSFGMIRLGNFNAESELAVADYVSMHNHDTGTSSDALYDFQRSPFVGNKIAYRTPDLGGLTVEGAVDFHENSAAQKKNGYDLAANYNNGPLALGAGFSKFEESKQFGLRALYSFGQFTVGGYYQRSTDVPVLGSRNAYRLAAMYALGASEFHVNVGRAAAWSQLSDSAATQWTLAYNYNLSKRTKVYAFYTKVDDNANADYWGAGNGVDFSSFAVGIRHNF